MPYVPEVHYAKSGELSIAYIDVGQGVPIVFVPGFISHVELDWEAPFYATTFEVLSAHMRLLTFDKRGTGLSDRNVDFGSLEERMDDVRAVMDAAGVERAHLFGISEGGPLAAFFAATYPERVDKLVLYGTYARLKFGDGYPYGAPREAYSPWVEGLERDWNTGDVLRQFIQYIPDTPEARAALARFERNTATPRMVSRIMWDNIDMDVRAALPLISAPTLVLHCSGDPLVDVEHARFLAEHIPGAMYEELDFDFHGSWLSEHFQVIAGRAERFFAGDAVRPEIVDRVLTTVMFTDIVDSTKQASQLGDARWRRLLDAHDRIVREEIQRYRGHEVNTTGDGFLATFDGPARAVQCAQSVTRRVRDCGVEVRAGVHTGECELRGDDVAGIAVHVGARVMSLAGPGEVFATRTVRDLVAGSGLTFEARGEHALRGVDEPVAVYAAAF
jgi:class 3 adenylate cyclase/pimeloyl-ACP methyl ester carboxylesterase